MSDRKIERTGTPSGDGPEKTLEGAALGKSQYPLRPGRAEASGHFSRYNQLLFHVEQVG